MITFEEWANANGYPLDGLGTKAARQGWDAAMLAAATTPEVEPVPMILHCPACGLQHIDAPDEQWTNPPHRSHLCHGCGHIWRPADVTTSGVESIQTKGEKDSAPPAPEVEPVVEILTVKGDEIYTRCLGYYDLKPGDVLYTHHAPPSELVKAAEALAPWMSAALGDPHSCQDFKDIAEAFLDALDKVKS